MSGRWFYGQTTERGGVVLDQPQQAMKLPRIGLVQWAAAGLRHSRGPFRPLLVGIIVPAAVTLHVAGAQLEPAVAAWLAAQTNLQSWSADFVQTRSLKSLTQPLTASGHVWFEAPNRFRWELGRPAQTIAVREPEVMLVIYPRLKRVERFPLNGHETGEWREALGLLEAGFPRSQSELESQYNLLGQTMKGGSLELVLQPKSAAARRMMPKIAIEFDTRGSTLQATELQFADGSTMRNDFTNAVLNPKIEPRMFSPEIPGDYKVVEPLKK